MDLNCIKGYYLTLLTLCFFHRRLNVYHICHLTRGLLALQQFKSLAIHLNSSFCKTLMG